MYTDRPIIKIIPTAIDRKIELAAKLLLLLMWLVTLVELLILPAIIPVHFNLQGKVDRYGQKLTLLILPVIGTCIYVGFSILNRYPHLFNYLTTITEANAEKQYTLATRMMRYMKAAVLLLFTIILVFVYLNIKGVVAGLGWWFLPFVFLLMVAPVIIVITKSLKK